ncbi:ribonuclease kappa-B-like [Anticarsia gemmatalis]|uniref:ribonuclease kappa-B-like n=1 Tax=Anticarsia gemmatalis TaxID=129554 RepID=UPI003F75A050
MSALMSCGICCMLISWWGVIQLFLMGILYYIEAPTLLHDTEAHEYDDYDDFIQKTKSNYNTVAINCWIAMSLYVVTLILSYTCIRSARKKAAQEAKLLEDEEYLCNPPPPKPSKKKKKY